MTEIRLTDRFRLRRLDERNWKLQELREPAPDSGGRVAADRSARWYDTDNYFQRLDAALAYTYERALREDDGSVAELADAMAKAQQLVKELKSSGGELS